MAWCKFSTLTKTIRKKIINISAVFALAASGLGLGLPLLMTGQAAAVAPNCIVDQGGGFDYTTIQAAVNDTNCTAITVNPGTYTETVTVNRAVTLTAASTSAIISGQVSLTADGAAVEGFTITNPSGDYGVVIPHVSNVTVSGNTINNVGTSIVGSSVYGLWYQGSTAVGTASNITISGNQFSNIGSASNTKSDGAILIGDSASHENITSGLVISGNTISSIASTKGAYGVEINLGSAADTASVTGASITSNNISGLSGGWKTAIGLEADTPNATLTNNVIQGSSVTAVNFDPNPSASTVSMSGNTLNGSSLSNSTSIVGVDGDWSALTPGANAYPEVLLGGQYYYYGLNAFSTIGQGVTAAASDATVNVAAGTYNESPSLSEAVTLVGAQVDTAGASHSGAESIITGTANITASDVTINGFEFTNAGTQVNVTSPSTLSGIQVENNIFSGYSGVGLSTYDAGNILIQSNLFENAASNSESMQIKASSVQGGCDVTQVLNNVFSSATNNSGADVNFSCTGSNSSDVTVSGNTSTGDSGDSSFTAFSGVDSGITISNNIATTDGSTVFFFGNVSGSASITGNTFTSTGGSAVSIHGGEYTSDTPNTGIFTITGNTLTGNPRAIYVSSVALGTGGKVVSDEAVSLPVNDSNQSTTSGDTTLSGSSSVTAVIPDGTTITASGSWDGTITPPTTTSVTIPGTSGYTTTQGIGISIGSDTVILTFSQAVRLVLPGQTGQRVGFIEPEGSFTEITTICGADDQTTVDAQLTALGKNECKYDNGTDMIVWTKHFTTFATYTLTANPSGGSSSGSSSGASSSTKPTYVTYASYYTPAGSAGSVLGESVVTPQVAGTSTTTGNVPGNSQKNQTNEKSKNSRFLVLGWYWLIPVAALGLGAGYWMLRRRPASTDK